MKTVPNKFHDGKAIAQRVINTGPLSKSNELLKESLYSVIDTELELSDRQRKVVVTTHSALEQCLHCLYNLEQLPDDWILDDVGFATGKETYLLGIETLLSCYMTSHRIDDSAPEERRKIYEFYRALKDLIYHCNLVYRNPNDLEPAA